MTGASQPTSRLKSGERSEPKKPPPAEGAPLEAPPEGPPEAPPEDPAEGAAGGKNYAIWLHFTHKKHDKWAKFISGFDHETGIFLNFVSVCRILKRCTKNIGYILVQQAVAHHQYKLNIIGHKIDWDRPN